MSDTNDPVYEEIRRQIDEVEQAYDRRSRTSKENAEKARQGKMEKKMIRDEQKKREAELKALKKKSKYEVTSSPSVDDISDDSEDEEYYIFPKKKIINTPNEVYLKEIEEMKKQINELRSKYDLHQTDPIIPSVTPVLPVESKPNLVKSAIITPVNAADQTKSGLVTNQRFSDILPVQTKPKTDSYMEEYNRILKRNIFNYK